MADARKCDLCGKFYDAYNTKNDSKKVSGLILANVDAKGRYFEHGGIDCCPECMNEIMSVMNKLKEKKHEASN